MKGSVVARALVAMVVGYAVVVLLTTLGFNVWLEGAELHQGGKLLLFQGTIVAVVAGLSGGYVAGSIGRQRPIGHAALVLVPLTIDTAYVLFWFEGTAPLWFDVVGSGILMASTLAGGIVRDLARGFGEGSSWSIPRRSRSDSTGR